MSILKDFKAFSKHSGSNFKTLTKVMFYSCVFYRVSHFFYKLRLVPISRFFWLLNRVLFSIDIDPRATFKGGIVILHGSGIVIGKSVLVLGDLKIYQGVTLGGNNGKKRIINGKEHSQPIINEGVIIGINAVVIGPIILGVKSSVGANAVITKDIPDGAIAVANNKIIN
jgi:serine O-acetyltransferase